MGVNEHHVDHVGGVCSPMCTPTPEWVNTPAREVDRLQARLAEVEAERDALHGIRQYAVASMEARVADAVRRAEAAEARLAKVEALMRDYPHCDEWSERLLAALRGEGDRG